MKRAYLLLLLLLLTMPFVLRAQNNKNIGIGTSNPDPSAILDITSSDKGILIPRLNSAQITAINAPVEGLMVYNLDSNCFFYYNNFKWASLCDKATASNGIHVAIINGLPDHELGGTLTQNTDIPLAGKKLTFSTVGSGGNVGIGTNNPDASSILDLTNSNNTGLLLPKVALTITSVAAPVTNPATGLMVFNTNTQNNVKPGYYFWDGTQWMRLFSSNLPVVSTVSVTSPIVNTGTAQDPNIGITTSDLSSTGVIAVSGGANRLTGAGGATLDVTGAQGGVLYGTGASSSFTPAGNTGEILKSNGNAAPTWVDPNSTLAKTDITGSTVVTVTNGASQLVGAGNTGIDVSGASGGVLYGTGGSSNFTSPGTTGQYLQANGIAAPSWTSGSDLNGSSVVNVSNGAGKILGLGNASIDVNGPQGTVLYGTGASSAFTVQGNSGELLQSNGTSAPTWVSPNNALVKSDLTGSTVVSITNGTGKVVGAGGAGVDVVGAQGGILYGTGGSSDFTAAGTAGQYLKSTGTTAPAWTTGSSVTGSPVVTIANGSNQVIGTSNMSIDVTGASGGVLYGTGASSAFTPAGTNGQILQSTGTGAPVWASPNAVLSTNNVTGGTVMTIANGNGQVVGGSNMNIDVSGANGGILYGTGASSNFTAAGTNGQILKSSGAGAPTWNTASNVTGGTVMSITNGTGQVVSGSNLNLDVAGANGGVMYGTGASSAFTPAGTAGQVLKSTGAGAPVWSSPNATLTTNDVVPAASSAVVVTNGTGQVVGGANMSLDVQGTNGGVFYGKGAGTAAAFSAVGTTGQVLQSNGAAAPTWVNPNTTLTTKNITNAGNGVIAVTSGTNQVVGASNATVDVVGTNGGVLYGTGASSNFTPVGTTGQILQSNGAAAPTWVNPNTTLTTKNITNAGNGVITVTSGTNQVVGASNATVDVVGTNGGVLYGTGASSAFSAVGTSGQILKSNGAAAPTWAGAASLVNVDNGIYYNGVSQTLRLGTNPLVENTTLTQAGFSFSVAGGTINLNDNSTNAVNIATNGSAGTVSVGTGSSAQTVSIANGAGAKTLNLGSTNTTSATNINSGTSGVTINDANSQPTYINSTSSAGSVNIGAGSGANQSINIATGAAVKTLSLGSTSGTSSTNINSGSGAVNINTGNSQATNINTGSNSAAVNIANGASSTGTVNIGTNNTEIVSGSAVGIGISPTVTEKLTVAGTTFSGINASTTSLTAGKYAIHGSSISGNDGYLGFVGATANVAVGSITNPTGYFLGGVSGQSGLTSMTNGTSTSAAIYGLSSVYYGGYLATSLTTGIGAFGYNAATSGTGSGVYGQTQSSTGNGVTALNNAALGAGTGYGLYAQTSQSGGPALYGRNLNTGTGVWGIGGNYFSMWNNVGGSFSALGIGLISTYNSALYTGAGIEGYGWGGTATGMSNDVGVYGNVATGTSAGVQGTYGTYSALTGAAGVYGQSSSILYPGVKAQNTNGNLYPGNIVTGYQTVSGTKSAVVPTSAGYQKLYCNESPEVWFEDIGRGTLVNGEVVITLDPLFLETVTIDAQHPMHVFLQEEGESEGLIVIPGTNSFTVKEKHHGTSNIAFSYKIEAKRRYYEDYRFGNEFTMGETVDWSQYKEAGKLPIDYQEAVKYFGGDKLPPQPVKPKASNPSEAMATPAVATPPITSSAERMNGK